MIRRLQHRFIRITMLSAFAIFFVLLTLINGIYIFAQKAQTDTTFSVLVENNGRFPVNAPDLNDREKENRETPFKTRYFVVLSDYSDSIRYVSIDKIAAIDTQTAIRMANEVLDGKKAGGKIGIYRYVIAQKYYGKLLIFIDCREQFETARTLIAVSVVLTAVIMLILFVLVYFFSQRAVKPVAESYDKQRQFITDAGHELKTPLSIISANTDVIEMCCEKNEWTQSTRRQVLRMNELIRQLITLARMDEQYGTDVFETFDLSEEVSDTVSSFYSLALTGNKNFTAAVQPDITYNGDREALRQLVCVLCDNALKYSPDGGTVSLRLHKNGRSVILSVFNTCEKIDTTDLDRLFDRFYRADSSRSRQTGGFGIGLSTAKAIVQAHKGKITVSSPDGKSITFTAVL